MIKNDFKYMNSYIKLILIEFFVIEGKFKIIITETGNESRFLSKSLSFYESLMSLSFHESLKFR